MSNILKSRIFPYQKLYRCKTTEVRTNGQKELSRNVLVLYPIVCKCRVNSGRDMLNSYIIKKKINDAQVSTDTPEMVQYPHPSPSREPLRVWLKDEAFEIENLLPG